MEDPGSEDDIEDFGPDDVTICDPPWIDDPDPEKQGKVRVRGVEVKLLNERVQYVNPVTGKLVTESIRDFSKRSLLNTVLQSRVVPYRLVAGRAKGRTHRPAQQPWRLP